MKMTPRSLAATAAAAIFDMPVFTQTAEFDLKDFDQISISSGIDSEIIIGPDFSIVAKTRNEKVMENLNFDLTNGLLKISCDSKFGDIFNFAKIDVFLTITLPKLNSITLNCGAEAKITGTFLDEFSAYASSGAELDIPALNALVVDISASSGAEITIGGACRFLSVEASSGAEINTRKLECEAVEVSSSSGGEVSVFANAVLASNASSGAEVRVFGSPTQADISDSSGGGTRLRK